MTTGRINQVAAVQRNDKNSHKRRSIMKSNVERQELRTFVPTVVIDGGIKHVGAVDKEKSTSAYTEYTPTNTILHLSD